MPVPFVCLHHTTHTTHSFLVVAYLCLASYTFFTVSCLSPLICGRASIITSCLSPLANVALPELLNCATHLIILPHHLTTPPIRPHQTHGAYTPVALNDIFLHSFCHGRRTACKGGWRWAWAARRGGLAAYREKLKRAGRREHPTRPIGKSRGRMAC